MTNPFQGRVTGGAEAIFDREQVLSSLSLFLDLGHAVHLTRSPGYPAHLLRDQTPEVLADYIETHFAGSKGIYYGLNPVADNVPRGRSPKDEHILHRRWLLVDCDPERTDPNSNSSDEEHLAAKEVAGVLLDTLSREKGWPLPVLVDSGNGFHCIYAIDLANDKESKDLLRDVLYVLAEKFNANGVKVDRACHDARRVCKLPGTWTRKGPNSEERPQRPSRLVYVPESLEIVTGEMLRRVASELVKEQKTKRIEWSIFRGRVSSGGEDAYYRAALASEVERCRMACKGDLNNQLFRSAAACGNLVGPGKLSYDTCLSALLDAIRAAGANNPAKDEDTVRRGLQHGMESPREAPEKPSVLTPHTSKKPNHNSEQKPASEESTEDSEPITVQACDIKTRKVDWLWKNRIPFGKLTCVAGMPGLGKTFFLCDLIGRVTSGAAWPDGAPSPEGKLGVLFVSGEDEPEDTLVPRLVEAGACLDRVRFFRSDIVPGFTLQSLTLLAKAVEESDEDIRLVCIDPPTSFTGDINDHNNSELRSALTPLSMWAAENRIAVVFVTHLNKGGAIKADAASRVSGSIAWVAATRASYLMSKDPDDETRRILATIKNNLAPEPPTLAYRIRHDDGGCGRIEWLGTIDTTADQAVNGVKSRTRKQDAERWLIDMFRQQPEWRSDELFKAGKEEGISRNAIWEAKSSLCLPKPQKRVTMTGEIYWQWWVPADWPPLLEDEQEATVAKF